MKHRLVIAIAGLSVTAAVALAGVAPAGAATVANDTVATATPLTSLPFDASYSLADANTEPLDGTLLCGEPSEHSVWYRFTATAQGVLRIDATTTDGFQPGVFISEGPPPSKTTQGCGNDEMDLTAVPGRTYYISVFARTPNAAGTVHVHVQLRPRTVFLAVDSVTKNADGSAKFSGTITCDPAAELGFIHARLAPNTGHEAGVDVQDFNCTGAPEPWSGDVAPYHGQLSGRMKVNAFAFICDDFACEEDVVDTVVTLNPH